MDGGVERRFHPFIALACSFPRGRRAGQKHDADAGRVWPPGRVIGSAASTKPPWHRRRPPSASAPPPPHNTRRKLGGASDRKFIGRWRQRGSASTGRPSARFPHIGHGRAGDRRRDTDGHGAATAGCPQQTRSEPRPRPLSLSLSPSLSLSLLPFRVLQRSTRASEADADANCERCQDLSQPTTCPCGPNGS